MDTPLRRAGRSGPRLEIITSPYRRLVRPLVDHVTQLKSDLPTRLIAVIVSELVEKRWYQYLLHNHRAEWLKADLLLEEDQRVALINVPWYSSERSRGPA